METDMEILYGRQPLLECLRAGRRDMMCLRLQAGVHSAGPIAEILHLARTRKIPVRESDKRSMDRITRNGHHQGVALEAGPYPFLDFESLIGIVASAGEPALLLLLDHIQDPQNLGSLLRSADAAGVHGVILPRDRCAEVTAAVTRASSGASEHARIARVPNLRKTLLDLRERGVRVIGLDGSASAVPYTGVPMEGPLGLVVGSEGEGLSHAVRNACDLRVALPMRGMIASLNAAIAGAILLFHVRAQREKRLSESAE